MNNNQSKRKYLRGGKKMARIITEQRAKDQEFKSKCKLTIKYYIENKKIHMIGGILDSMYWYIIASDDVARFCMQLFKTDNLDKLLDKFIKNYENNYNIAFNPIIG